MRKVSEFNPLLIYPYYENIAQLIHHSNHFIQWGAIQILANLTSIDINMKFDSIYHEYFDLIHSDSMITAANVVGGSWKTIKARPELETDITNRLLQVNNYTYLYKHQQSIECKNILIGHVIDCFDQYYAISKNKPLIVDFERGHQLNERKSTAKKASNFINKHANK